MSDTVSERMKILGLGKFIPFNRENVEAFKIDFEDARDFFAKKFGLKYGKILFYIIKGYNNLLDGDWMNVNGYNCEIYLYKENPPDFIYFFLIRVNDENEKDFEGISFD